MASMSLFFARRYPEKKNYACLHFAEEHTIVSGMDVSLLHAISFLFISFFVFVCFVFFGFVFFSCCLRVVLVVCFGGFIRVAYDAPVVQNVLLGIALSRTSRELSPAQREKKLYLDGGPFCYMTPDDCFALIFVQWMVF